MKSLVVYGTRGGATKGIAEEIGKVLGSQGFEPTVVNAGKTRGIDVNAYDLVVVGSSVWANMWKWQASRFVKKNQKKLAAKKVALFTSGLAAADPTKKDYIKESIEKQAAKYPLIKPLGLAYFGGYVNFDGKGIINKFFADATKKDLETKGIDTSKNYDTRNFEEIRKWAADVAMKAKA